MNYNDAFAIDDISFLERKKEAVCTREIHELRNYDYYKPKLVNDFYLKYFTRELLFERDILEVNEFLQYHYDYCVDPDLYFDVLDLKVMPKIDELIENAQVSLEIGVYNNEIKLDDGFVESEGVIHNFKFDYSLMLHQIDFSKLQNDLKKRKQIVESFIKQYIDNNNAPPKLLRWTAGPSKLAVVIRELIDKGYMEADIKNGEINCSSLSRDLFQTFSIENCTSAKTIEIYLNNNSKKYSDLKKSFDRAGFFVPPSNFT